MCAFQNSSAACLLAWLHCIGVFFMEFSEIWSCLNTVFYILKINCILSLTFCPAQPAMCWITVLCYGATDVKWKACKSAAEGSGSPELQWSRNATWPHSVEAHTLTWVETNQICCRAGAEMHHTCIKGNLGIMAKKGCLLITFVLHHQQGSFTLSRVKLNI